MYCHISSVMSPEVINFLDPDICLINIVLNGEVIGSSTYSTLEAVLSSEIPHDNLRLLSVHSLLGHNLPGLKNIFRSLDPAESHFWVHDYATVCPGFNLMRNQVEFCDAPENGSHACLVCVYGPARQEQVSHLQALFQEVKFKVLAPSATALDIWHRASALKAASTAIIPHCIIKISDENYLPSRKSTSSLVSNQKPARVAFLGHPTIHKGWPIFEKIVRASSGDQTLEFYHFAELGSLTDLDGVTGIATRTSSYADTKLIENIRSLNIEIIILPSLWPETFSFTTIEGIVAGCDVFTLQGSGNIAAITGNYRSGMVFRNEDALVEFFSKRLFEEYANNRVSRQDISIDRIGTSASLV